jgi:hypothetical protein
VIYIAKRQPQWSLKLLLVEFLTICEVFKGRLYRILGVLQRVRHASEPLGGHCGDGKQLSLALSQFQRQARTDFDLKGLSTKNF